MSDRWTVRGVDPEARQLLVEVRDACGLTTGALLSDAIRRWHKRLPVLPTFTLPADNSGAETNAE